MKISEMCKIAAKHGNPGVAITDHGNMSAVYHLQKEAAKYGLNPIFGCEFYMNNKIGETDENGKRVDRSGDHCIVLAKNEQGYKNMCRLNYLSFNEGFYYRPKITRKQLFEYSDGLIVTTSCISHEINKLILKGEYEEAYNLVEEYRVIFKDDFYIEIQLNELDMQKQANTKLIEFANLLNIPIILTSDVHYPYKGDADLQDLLIHLNRGTTIKTEKEKIFALHARNLYYTTRDDIQAHNQEWKYGYSEEFIDKCLENTLEINDKCRHKLPVGKLQFPVFDYTNTIIKDKKFESAIDYLICRCDRALKKLEIDKIIPFDKFLIDDYKKRYDFELKAICDNGYADYFLIIADLCDYAVQNKIARGAARGSVSGSLIAFLLGITDIDPLRFNLYFERFMGGTTAEDVRTPDIDLDFDSDNKDKLEKYLGEKYGQDHVAHVITCSTFNARGILRDLTRVLNRNSADISFMCKALPEKLSSLSKHFNKIKKELISKDSEELGKSETRTLNWINDNQDLIEYADRLLHQVRHYGKHACAVVVTPGPIYDYIPVNRVNGGIVTGFQESGDLKELQDLGLLKIDILGLNNVSIIDHTIDMVKTTQNKDITSEVKNINLDNPKLYSKFAEGKNAFVFQFSSDGINKLIKATKPDCFEDVCAINSLYRPANLASGMAWKFAKCKRDADEREYAHPALKTILEKNYSLCCYQEDLMEICHDIAGFSWVDSDKTRKNLYKWNKMEDSEKDKFQNKFIDGCKEHSNIDENGAKDIFDFLVKHVGYLFNKSHSVAYSLLAMQTIFLKIYYPLEFYSVVLSRTMSGKNDAATLISNIENIRNMGINILSFDINESKENFDLKDGNLRASLRLIDGLGDKGAHQIVENQPYINMYDFLTRNTFKGSKVNKKHLDHLVKVGAFQSLESNWAKADVMIALFQNDSKKFIKEGEGSWTRAVNAAFAIDEVVDWTIYKKMEFEQEVIGCNIFFSPFSIGNRGKVINKLIDKKFVKTGPAIIEQTAQAPSVLMITKIKSHIDKRGNDMAFIQAKDYAGNDCDIVIFSSAFRHVRDKIKEGSVYYMLLNSKGDSLAFGPEGWQNSKQDYLDSLIDFDTIEA